MAKPDIPSGNALCKMQGLCCCLSVAVKRLFDAVWDPGCSMVMDAATQYVDGVLTHVDVGRLVGRTVNLKPQPYFLGYGNSRYAVHARWHMHSSTGHYPFALGLLLVDNHPAGCTCTSFTAITCVACTVTL